MQDDRQRDSTLNYFQGLANAHRYAAYRPFFHPHVIDEIRRFLHFEGTWEAVLDIGCGTGQSALALREVSHTVVGADISSDMLREAPRDGPVLWTCAAAERLPFKAGAFDVITAGLAFHWFEPASFLSEASRTLKVGGWLVVYNNVFRGQSPDVAWFENWYRTRYEQRYPLPPRNDCPPPNVELATCGLRLRGTVTYTNQYAYQRHALIEYLLSRTNILAAVRSGRETLAVARSWLRTELVDLNEHEAIRFAFGGPISFIAKPSGVDAVQKSERS
jgi:SAM-dependent methyltransferase